MDEKQKSIKIRIAFDGWHCLSKRQTNEILKMARNFFKNANFFNNNGLLIEHVDEISIYKFCLDVIEIYRNSLGSWNGYEIKKISKKVLYNFADRKRKLNFEYFKKLVRENLFADIRLILAGKLYLEPEEISNVLVSIEKDFEYGLREMDDKALNDAYRLLLMYASSKERNFSLHK